jgi:hypothetical protein
MPTAMTVKVQVKAFVAYQAAGLHPVGQPDRSRVREAERPAQAEDRLAGVMSQRHERCGLNYGGT